MCRPQPVNRRFRVSRYLARASRLHCGTNSNVMLHIHLRVLRLYRRQCCGWPGCVGVCVTQCGLRYVLCSVRVTIAQLLVDVCVLGLGEEQLLLLPHGSKPDHTAPSS